MALVVRRVLVTGAAGFVGSALCARLAAAAIPVRRVLRTAVPGAVPGDAAVVVADLADGTFDDAALQDVDAVVHLAARVHVLREAATDPLRSFRAVNVEATRRLAETAARAGVRRFVFLSSVKVNGEATTGRAFTEADPPRPEDPYGVSKREAEDALREIATRTGLEVVILRPPLVYGPGVKANFLRLLRWVDRGVPLPLAAVNNRRSLVYVGNLADAIVRGLEHPAAPGETFLVDDGAPVSTAQLLREIGAALHRPARLLPMPPAWLRAAARLAGRGEDAARLLGDLEVDGSHLRRTLGWQPPFTRRQGLAGTAAWFRAGR
jgi:nucleoside-diphosphate-sugar epimerase